VDTIEQAQQQSRTRFFWFVNYLSDYTGFDFLWEPVPWQSEYTHTWPSQWHTYSGTYLVPKNSKEIKYYFNTQILPNKILKENFNIIKDNIIFDYSWAPHPMDPPYNYVFGNQWYPANKDPSIEYKMPGATEIKYIFTPRAKILSSITDLSWNTLIECDFDYSWLPDPGDPPYIYVFGNQWWSAIKMPTVEYCVPDAVERKYMPYPRAEIKANNDNWKIPDAVDIESFDFSWIPDPGDSPYIYQFGTQHQRTGGPQYIISGATEIKYVDQIRIKTERTASAIYEIDHMDGNAGKIPDTTKIVRYFDNYLDTLRRIARNNNHEFVWICSSACDYSNFDFTWHPEVWQSGMLHVFASDDQKFGDTFFMHVPTFQYRATQIELLDWYDLNFINTSVPRRPLPVIRHNNDSQVEFAKTANWNGPLAIFAAHDRPIESIPCVPLWREKTKTLVPLDQSGSTVIVPKVSIPYIKEQLYDYPYIDKTQRKTYRDQPLDIVFISNGEPAAEDTFMHLQNVASDLFIKQTIHRVDGVNGRVAAYHAAANTSNTPWFFAVFAKLFVNENFDWDWQPDRMQQAKHYIFHALNPVNGLEYGHQAMIAYNKQLVLNNTGRGLDFTLDDAHEVVPMLSGTAVYNMSPWVAWRTAFREALKLKISLPDVENEYRLTQWLSTNPGSQHIVNEQWSRWGAEDAVEYFDEVAGEFTALKKSYEWDWLASYAFIKRNLTPDQQ
jgi:hypothetical protein